jgi:ribosome-associated translation inhibitor RaiA
MKTNKVAPTAHIPVQITFRHMPASPAVSERVDEEAQKLLRYFDRITHCHVVIVAPHRHHRLGQQYSVHLELGVPRERLVITNEPAPHPRALSQSHVEKQSEYDAAHKDLYIVIREVFDTARRQLEDYVRRLRGDVKRHSQASPPEGLPA